MIIVRPAIEADSPSIVAITNAQTNEGLTLEGSPGAERCRPATAAFQRLVAVLPDGCVAGFAQAVETDMAEAHHFRANIAVAEPYRRQSAGTVLCQALADWVRARGAIRLEGVYRTQLSGHKVVVSWELDQCLEIPFVLETVHRGFTLAQPSILNSDQGSHFTSPAYIDFALLPNWTRHCLRRSVMSRGRAIDGDAREGQQRQAEVHRGVQAGADEPGDRRLAVGGAAVETPGRTG